MPVFVNRDQIFAHQVHLLEHKLRSKEEKILELETENAILHLRLADKMRQDSDGTKTLERLRRHQKISPAVVTKLLSDVQEVKRCLSEIFAVYVSFASELEEQSRDLLDKLDRAARDGCRGDRVQTLERALEDERGRCRAERERRKQLHNTLVELRGNIRVHCRVRPVLSLDRQPSGSRSSEEVIHVVSDDTLLVKSMKSGTSGQTRTFEFERVHGPEDSQETVFEEVKPLLTSLLDGYNVCVMAYGQTGSGKTHTMMGGQRNQRGLVPQAAEELFRLIRDKPSENYTVEVSVVEVYNNEVLDLLARDERGNAPSRHKDVITTSAGGSEVAALTHQSVSDAADVLQVVDRVLRLRAHASTLVHADSSRSHLVVSLGVSSRSPHALALARRLRRARQDSRRSGQKEWWSPRCRRANPPADDASFASAASSPSPSPSHSPCPSPRPSVLQTPFKTRLQLVDLAGSECVGMSGSSGAALWEVSCINRSLSALSDVLAALAENRPHVPYRNSRLTHLLQDSIGGDAKLLVMLCVSPTHHFMTESLQTLGFGTRARQVQRDPPRNKNHTLRVK